MSATANTEPDDYTGPMIEFKYVNKWFDDFHVLLDINLSIDKGEKVVVCGPSGSGKSTMIRCINRLEVHQEGTIRVVGKEMTDDLRNIEAIRRNVGMVFQSFNLFSHLSVMENLTIGPICVLKMQEKAAVERGMELQIGRAHV